MSEEFVDIHFVWYFSPSMNCHHNRIRPVHSLDKLPLQTLIWLFSLVKFSRDCCWTTSWSWFRGITQRVPPNMSFLLALPDTTQQGEWEKPGRFLEAFTLLVLWTNWVTELKTVGAPSVSMCFYTDDLFTTLAAHFEDHGVIFESCCLLMSSTRM